MTPLVHARFGFVDEDGALRIGCALEDLGFEATPTARRGCFTLPRDALVARYGEHSDEELVSQLTWDAFALIREQRDRDRRPPLPRAPAWATPLG